MITKEDAVLGLKDYCELESFSFQAKFHVTNTLLVKEQNLNRIKTQFRFCYEKSHSVSSSPLPLLLINQQI